MKTVLEICSNQLQVRQQVASWVLNRNHQHIFIIQIRIVCRPSASQWTSRWSTSTSAMARNRFSIKAMSNSCSQDLVVWSQKINHQSNKQNDSKTKRTASRILTSVQLSVHPARRAIESTSWTRTFQIWVRRRWMIRAKLTITIQLAKYLARPQPAWITMDSREARRRSVKRSALRSYVGLRRPRPRVGRFRQQRARACPQVGWAAPKWP